MTELNTLDPATDLKHDEDKDKPSPSKVLIRKLTLNKAPIAAVVTKNIELFNEILLSERFQKFKLAKSSLEQKKNSPTSNDTQDISVTNKPNVADSKSDSQANEKDNDEPMDTSDGSNINSDSTTESQETKPQTIETEGNNPIDVAKTKGADTEQPTTEAVSSNPFDSNNDQNINNKDKNTENSAEITSPTEKVNDVKNMPEQMELNQAMLASITLNQPEMFAKLLEAGADVHAFDHWYPVLHTILDMQSIEIFDIAVKYAKNLKVEGHYGNLLHAAVRSGSLSLVKTVYNLGVTDIINCEANGSTPLHDAVRNVPFLVKSEASCSSSDANNKTGEQKAMETAPATVSSNNETTSTQDVKKQNDCDTSTKDAAKDDSYQEGKENKKTALFAPPEYDLSIIDFLIDTVKCPLESTDQKGKTALHEAAIFGNKVVVRKLIDAGMKKHVLDNSQYTPWLYAGMYDHTDIWEDLYEAENVNTPFTDKFDHKFYLIHVVCTNLLDKALQFMIDKGGVDLLVQDERAENQTPLMLSIQAQLISTHRDPDQCITILLNQPDPGIHASSRAYCSPFAKMLLHFSRLKDETKDLFVKKGSDVNALIDGQTPLIRYLQDINILKWLLRHGADPNYELPDSMYPLYQATDHRNADALKLLLKYNADIYQTQKSRQIHGEGFTPLKLAIERSNYEMTRLCVIAGFSCYELHDWLQLGEDSFVKEICDSHPDFRYLLQYIKNKPHQPISLKSAARITVLKCLNLRENCVNLKQLELPLIMEEYLDWDKYFEMRENELDRAMNHYKRQNADKEIFL